MAHEVQAANATVTASTTRQEQPGCSPRGGRTWVVTRHRGAMQWLRERGWDGEMVPHFDSALLQPGDRVIGTLPLQLAAEVCEKGGHYSHLSMEVPLQLRGEELTAQQMEHCGAHLQAFLVQRLPDGAGTGCDIGTASMAQPSRP